MDCWGVFRGILRCRWVHTKTGSPNLLGKRSLLFLHLLGDGGMGRHLPSQFLRYACHPPLLRSFLFCSFWIKAERIWPLDSCNSSLRCGSAYDSLVVGVHRMVRGAAGVENLLAVALCRIQRRLSWILSSQEQRRSPNDKEQRPI